MSQAPVAVSILTGFLGAGKTTLLNRLLKEPDLGETAVIINEFGEVSLDHLLVEQATEGIIELAGGCLCCTVRGDLVDTLADLIDRMQTGRIAPLKRIVIETSGLADPVPVLQSVMGHPALVQALRLDGVVTVVDAVNGAATLDAHETALRQVAVADRLVLTKASMVGGETVARLSRRLGQLNPAAPLLDAEAGTLRVSALFDCGLYDPAPGQRMSGAGSAKPGITRRTTIIIMMTTATSITTTITTTASERSRWSMTSPWMRARWRCSSISCG